MSPDTEQEVRRIDALLNSFQTTSSPGRKDDAGKISLGPMPQEPNIKRFLNSPSYPGRKDDAGKPRWSLIPTQALEDVVKVLTYGARKYGDDNWREVEDGPRRYYDAAMRHVVAHRQGIRLDDESGLPHLAHAVASLLFIMALEREGQ